MKTHIVYHKADFDGIFAGAICKRHLPDAEVHGWDFGDPIVEVPVEDAVYIVDLPLDTLFGCLTHSGPIVWIDHHASSIAKFADLPDNCESYLIDGVAASRLCWQWFTNRGTGGVPPKEWYLDRQVPEPYALRLVGEFDVWDKRDDRAELFQYVLTASLNTSDEETKLSRAVTWLYDPRSYVESKCASDGRAIESYLMAFNRENVQQRSYRFDWEGLKWLALNTVRGNSLSFRGGDMEGIEALYLWRYDGEKTIISLYQVEGQEHHDLSLIAKKYGGGGHKAACGFTVPGLWEPHADYVLKVGGLK